MRTIAFCVLLISSVFVYGQELQQTHIGPNRVNRLGGNDKVYFGISGGINYPSAIWSGYNSYNYTKGALSGNINLFAQIPVDYLSSFYFQPELGIATTSNQFNAIAGTSAGANFSNYYVYIPVSALFKYNVRNSGFSFLVGPSYNFNASVKQKTDGVASSATITNQFANYLGGVVGADYYLTPLFGVSARYNFSLMNGSNIAGINFINNYPSLSVQFRF